MQEYNICYSLDTAYTEQILVSIVSILKNADVEDNINFYILDGGLTEKDKAEIELLKNIKTFCIKYIKVDDKDFLNCPLLKEKDASHKDYHVTIPTYYRFKLPDYLQSCKKVLYLDCDVIVRCSLKELYNIDLKNTAAAMVLDAESKKESKRLKLKNYFNAGVMLINLDFWRENDVVNKLFDFALKNQEIILWQDQDIINSVLAQNIKKVDNSWNYQYFLYENIDNNPLVDCKILHLAGRFKPWLIAFEHPVYEEYYYYLSFTSKMKKIIEYRHNSLGRFLKNNIGGSDTNILITATNEDIQKVYKSIDENYNFVKEQVDLVNKENDIKLSAVYEEITKNYDFTKSLVWETGVKNEEIKNQLEQKIDEKTSALTADSDDKISKIYNEISKNYDYANNLSESLKNEIYSLNITTEQALKNQIQENYNDSEQKFTNIYEEIAKTYSFAQKNSEDLKIKLENETNDKIDSVYKEITNNYEFTKEKIEEARVNAENAENEKISLIYDEISKNYDYTDTLAEKSGNRIEEVKTILEQNLSEKEVKINAETEEKISLVYDEISKNYKYTEELVEKTNNTIQEKTAFAAEQTDAKLSKVYEDIAKNREYSEELDSKIKETKSNLSQSREEILSKIDEAAAENNDRISQINVEIMKNSGAFENKILQIRSEIFENEENNKNKFADIQKEISKNAQYTDFLVTSVEEKQNQLRIDSLKEINDSINALKWESDDKLNKSVMALNISMDEKIRILDEVFGNKLNEVSGKIYETANEINKETNLKFSELYSYTNEQTSRLFKELKDSNLKIENTLNGKIYDLYKRNDSVQNEINVLNRKLEDRPDNQRISALKEEIKQEFEAKGFEYLQKLSSLQNDFEEKLNRQRLKYENKLINMENKLEQMEAYMKKNAFAKLLDKFKKTKKR